MMPPNLQIFLQDLGELFKNTFKEWYHKDPFRESAVIAYYAVFSIPGLLVLIITVAGYFFGKEAVSANIVEQVSSIMGLAIATQIKEMLIAGAKTQSTFWGAVIGIATIIIGATGGHADLTGFNPNIDWKGNKDYTGVADGADEIRKRVRNNIK